MILHLGDDVSVHSADIVAIIDLTQSQNPVTGARLAEIRRQNRILARQGDVAKSAVICAGARRAGGMTENARVYLSPISTVTLAQRAHERAYPAADSLFEAARIDGAGHFRVFISIVLPLFKAGLATIGLFNVVSRWNDWFTGMLYITANDSLIPLQTLLQKIQSSIDFLKRNAGVGSTPDGLQYLRTVPTQSLRMACTVIIVVPILAAYPFFQRYFVQGLTMGSIKE